MGISGTSVGSLVDERKQLFYTCTCNIQFHFIGCKYGQIDGVAIGPLLGAVLADIFIDKLENSTLLEQTNKRSFYKQCMNDV